MNPGHSKQRSSFILRRTIAAICGLLFLAGASRCLSAEADRKALPSSGDPIPRKDYKTWSLFLITNTEWLLDQSNDKVSTLYKQFTAFGDAIGPDNLAVWFWSDQPDADHAHKTVDVTRSVAFCRRLKLKPGEGPYVLVMTEYPGKSVLDDYPNSFPDNSTNILVIKLNGTDAASTARLLSDLADGLVTENLSRLRAKSDDYWSGWRKVFAKVTDSVLGVSSKVTVEIDTGPAKTKIKLGP